MNPILLNIPMPIETPRLFIRPPQAGDGLALNAAIIESFDEFNIWLPWAKANPTIEESEENIRIASANWILRNDLRLMIFEKNSGRLVGNSGLHRMNWNLPSFEIGYWCRTSDTRKGYITEAVNAITRFAFNELHAKRIEIRCDPDNEKSFKIPKKLGYELEARLKNSGLKAKDSKTLRDTFVFTRLNADQLPELDAKW